ncbi:hypothetical protein [Nocardia sp. NPDC051570]|uniref:hypothetical protein n=1 Tax=Nocardia sp. NPDC051570 TaxID=3364324 RepID=UPI00379A3F78
MATPDSDGTWSDLKTRAGDGRLKLEEGIAAKCAQHVETMVNAIIGTHTWIQQNYQRASPDIAATGSGAALKLVFNNKIGQEMEERLDRHRDILIEMGNAFVAAGRAYQAAEHSSKVSFDNISFTDPGGTPPPGEPYVQAIPPRGTPDWPDSRMDKVHITPEEGTNFSWQQLYSIGQSINPQAVADAGGVWYWLAQDALTPAFTELDQNISAASDQWTGQGGDRAIAATQRYVQASQQLVADMNKLGDVLIFTAGWLQQTKSAMPPTPEPPTTTGSGPQAAPVDLAEVTRPYQEAFTADYTDNFEGTTGNIVTLPQPHQVAGTLDVNDSADDDKPGDKNPDDTEPDDTKPNKHETGDGDPAGDGPEKPDPSTHTPDGEPKPNPHDSNPPTDGDIPPNKPEMPTNPDLPPADPTKLPFDSSKPPTGLLNSVTDPSKPLSENRTPYLMPPFTGALATNTEKGLLSRFGGGLGGAPLAAESKLLERESKLFPRASRMVERGPLGRAGAAGGSEPGMPLGGAGARRNEEKERKRSEQLKSTEYLDEAVGEVGRGIRPVLDR